MKFLAFFIAAQAILGQTTDDSSSDGTVAFDPNNSNVGQDLSVNNPNAISQSTTSNVPTSTDDKKLESSRQPGDASTGSMPTSIPDAPSKSHGSRNQPTTGNVAASGQGADGSKPTRNQNSDSSSGSSSDSNSDSGSDASSDTATNSNSATDSSSSTDSDSSSTTPSLSTDSTTRTYSQSGTDTASIDSVPASNAVMPDSQAVFFSLIAAAYLLV